MLEIIGPGVITVEHKKEILFQTSELEKKVLEVNRGIEELCKSRTGFAEDILSKLNDFLHCRGIDDKIKPIPVKVLFSSFSNHTYTELTLPLRRYADGGVQPEEMTEDDMEFIMDLNEQYAMGICTFTHISHELRETQRQAYNDLLRQTMVQEFFEQPSMGQGNVIIYLENNCMETLDRYAFDLTRYLAPQLENEPSESKFEIPFNPTASNVDKLRKEAKPEQAAVYVVSHFSELISPDILIDYAAQMLQNKYVKQNSGYVKSRQANNGRPALVISKSDDGQVYGVKIGDFELSEKSMKILMSLDADDLT